jgi:kynurenine formamidase
MQLVDLSHTVRDGLVTYPGLPAPVIRDHLSRAESRTRYAPGTEFQIGRIEMVANTGTYMDAPFHRFAGGADIAGLPLSRLASLPGLLVDATGLAGRSIDAGSFTGLSLSGRAVLIRTGWDAHWRTPRYGQGHPFLTRGAAEALVAGGPALVGIDTLNIDDTSDGTRPAHTLLLEAGIPIVEHLCDLGSLPARGFLFTAVPAPVRGMGSFPVRAYAALS